MSLLRWVLAGIPIILLTTFGVHRLWTLGVDATLPAVDDPDDAMSPEMAARFEAFRRHSDEALHVANTCVMCEFDRARAPREDAS